MSERYAAVSTLSICPYKTHLGATFPWLGPAAAPAGGAGELTGAGEPNGAMGRGHDERAHGNGGYFHLQPGNMYVGGGMWRMEKPRLEAFRAVVRDDPERVQSVFAEPAFVAWFGGVRPHDELRRHPPGWPRDHPLAEMFRWKDVVFGRQLGDGEVLSPELPDRLAEGYATAVPVFRFLSTLG